MRVASFVETLPKVVVNPTISKFGVSKAIISAMLSSANSRRIIEYDHEQRTVVEWFKIMFQDFYELFRKFKMINFIIPYLHLKFASIRFIFNIFYSNVHRNALVFYHLMLLTSLELLKLIMDSVIDSYNTDLHIHYNKPIIIQFTVVRNSTFEQTNSSPIRY